MDKFLRVQGAEGVFAVGDCSTIVRETRYGGEGRGAVQDG